MAPNSRKLHLSPMKSSTGALTNTRHCKSCRFGHLYEVTLLIHNVSLLRYYIFYSATVPLLSFLHMVVDLSLCLTARLRPFYALTGAILFLCGWAGQVGFWTSCELPSGFEISGHECYQHSLQTDEGGFKGVPLSLANWKAAFGYLCILL